MPLVDKPGIYDMPSEAYHSDPAPTPSLSCGIAKILIGETPQHAWCAHPRLNPAFKREEDGAFDIGNAAHSLMLGDPKTFHVVDFDDWRTKDAKHERESARKTGMIPMLARHWERVVAMVEAGRAQLAVHMDASDAFTKGKPEQSLFWKEGETWLRIRPDWLPDDRKHFDDYKSTTCADPDVWSRVVFAVGHDMQAAFYRRGIRALGLARNPVMRFVVQEIEKPFALSVVELGPDVLEMADRRVDRAIQRWNWCRRNGIWPGYPARTCTIAAPPWHENRLMERELRDAEIARVAGVPETELLALAMKFQAP